MASRSLRAVAHCGRAVLVHAEMVSDDELTVPESAKLRRDPRADRASSGWQHSQKAQRSGSPPHTSRSSSADRASAPASSSRIAGTSASAPLRAAVRVGRRQAVAEQRAVALAPHVYTAPSRPTATEWCAPAEVLSSLTDGSEYRTQLAATNGAGVSVREESHGFVLDGSPPANGTVSVTVLYPPNFASLPSLESVAGERAPLHVTHAIRDTDLVAA